MLEKSGNSPKIPPDYHPFRCATAFFHADGISLLKKEVIVRKKIGVSIVLLAVLILGGYLLPSRLFSSARADAQLQPMNVGGVPSLVQVSKLQGRDTSGRTLRMGIGLALRNQERLSSLLQRLYDPSSPDYHRYLTPNQFASEFGPTYDQQEAVIHYLKQQGFSVTQTYTGLIDFSGPQPLAERVFHVTINDYRDPDGRVFYANASPPTLPAYLASYVVSLTGLDNATQYYHPPIRPKHIAASNPRASNCPGPGTSGGTQVAYIPSQFSKAYNYDGLHNQGLHGEARPSASLSWMATRRAIFRPMRSALAAQMCRCRTLSWMASMVSRARAQSQSNWISRCCWAWPPISPKFSSTKPPIPRRATTTSSPASSKTAHRSSA